MSKIAIFASGNGSNAARLTHYFNSNVGSITIDCFVTNKKKAGIYDVAQKLAVPLFYFENQDFEKVEKLLSFLKSRGVNWIVLAGFLRKIPSDLIREYEGRIINLHPSLLPKFGGKGMYGKYVHQAVLENEESESGISIHLVNEEFDKGRILFQQNCLIEVGEDVASLTKKIQALEHEYFPRVIEETIEEATIVNEKGQA